MTNQLLERAKAALAVSRAKMEAKEEETAAEYIAAINSSDVVDSSSSSSAEATTKKKNGKKEDKNNKNGSSDATATVDVPFFATNDSIDNDGANMKKEKVIKNKNEDTGLFTTDGDLMAKLSEEEEWEQRSLLEVFTDEVEDDEYQSRSANADNEQFIDRDIAESMYNLRKSLQTEDFTKIFDKRNRFIGDA